MADAFGHPPGVDEHEGRGVFFDQVANVVEDLAHLLGRCNRLHLRGRNDQVKVEFADVAFVDDLAVEVAVRALSRPDQQIRDGRDGFLGRGQPDPHDARSPSCFVDVVEAFERQRQMRASLVSCERVDLVDDDRVYRAERGAGPRRRAHEIERLGGRDDERRGLLDHGGTRRRWSVARAHTDADRRSGQAHRFRDGRDLFQGPFEVFGNVDGERFERRHVDNPGNVVGRLAAFVCLVEPIDRYEEGRQRLSRAGRRSDKRVRARGDVGPRRVLWRCWPVGKLVGKPRPHSRVKGLHPGLVKQTRTFDIGVDDGHCQKLPMGSDSEPCPLSKIPASTHTGCG